MPSRLALSYNNKIKTDISATKHISYYAMLGSGYKLEYFAYKI
jgi:hypothetical protein